jgi:hypothetical protein
MGHRELDGNPNLHEVITWAEAHGVTVEKVHRTGEVRFLHPSFGKFLTANARRKDSTRRVLSALRRLAKETP